MDDVTIPDEVVEAMARPIYDALEGPVANQDYTRQLRQWEQAKEVALAAARAMLAAWPDAWIAPSLDNGRDCLALPIQQETKREAEPDFTRQPGEWTGEGP